VFTGAGVKTVVLFFTKGEPTQKIWYYQLDKHFTKTQPLTEDDLADFLTLQKTKADSENSWSIDVSSLGEDYDLSVKNPNKVEEKDERTPAEIYDSIAELNEKATDLIQDALASDLWPNDFDTLFADNEPEDEFEEHKQAYLKKLKGEDE
jgi:type I restriction enzyme M protein